MNCQVCPALLYIPVQHISLNRELLCDRDLAGKSNLLHELFSACIVVAEALHSTN